MEGRGVIMFSCLFKWGGGHTHQPSFFWGGGAHKGLRGGLGFPGGGVSVVGRVPVSTPVWFSKGGRGCIVS